MERWEHDGILHINNKRHLLAAQHVILPYANWLCDEYVASWNAHTVRKLGSPNSLFAEGIEARKAFLQPVNVDEDGNVLPPVIVPEEVQQALIVRAIAEMGGLDTDEQNDKSQVIVEPPVGDIPWWREDLTPILSEEVPSVVFDAPGDEDGDEYVPEASAPRLRAAFVRACEVIELMASEFV